VLSTVVALTDVTPGSMVLPKVGVGMGNIEGGVVEQLCGVGRECLRGHDRVGEDERV
jgi:hypothetical protein